jgi:transcriptional regulator with GAF, ATPase, and Fis domain
MQSQRNRWKVEVVLMATSLTFKSADSGIEERSLEQIIGSSAALGGVLAKVDLVAPTDSTVLVLGETGTGKKLVVRAVHNLSRRAGRPFVKANCAAIPFDLLESELFGHERGAFTGAIAQKIGRFEMADTGSLFPTKSGTYLWRCSRSSSGLCKNRSSSDWGAAGLIGSTFASLRPHIAICPA